MTRLTKSLHTVTVFKRIAHLIQIERAHEMHEWDGMMLACEVHRVLELPDCPPDDPTWLRCLAACEAEMKELRDAEAEVERTRAADPIYAEVRP